MSINTEIWVFGDLRTRHLFDLSLKVVAKSARLAETTGDRVVLFAFRSPDAENDLSLSDRSTSENDATCGGGGGGTTDTQIGAAAFSQGADEVFFIEHEAFSSPQVHVFATALSPLITEKSPRLAVFPMTEFGRDLAARTAADIGAGLMAHCVSLKQGADGGIVGICPSFGGEVISEITYASHQETGFATVLPHGEAAENVSAKTGKVVRQAVSHLSLDTRIRQISSQRAPVSDADLESAKTVVVGGAGLGSAAHFGAVRDLAAALSGQVAATRPPVLSHWVDETRLIGQTGKTIRPDLLISVGTSGAIQYTAGIMGAGTIVAINRDPSAPIFGIADMGVIADAPTFLPLLSRHIRKTVMRQIADEMCAEADGEASKTRGAEKIRSLRLAHGWSVEKLAEATGQTPEFITGVEAGDISPPVAFFLRLSTAYGVDPGVFLRDAEKNRIRDQRNQDYVNRTRNYSYQSLTSGAEHDHLRAFMITIEPHHDHKPVAYKHDGEEFIFVMEGKLEFTLGSKLQTLNPGESVHFHSNTPHKLKSLSSDITRCLVILYTV